MKILNENGIPFFLSGGKRRYLKLTLCPTCETNFFGYYSKFCSPQCNITRFKKGQVSVNKGKKFPATTGSRNHNWKGGISRHTLGYIEQRIQKHPYKSLRGYVLQHRLVVESHIDRYLLPTESVHHLGAKDDNRPIMLMAFISEKYHQLFENGKEIPQKAIIFDGRKLKTTNRRKRQ